SCSFTASAAACVSGRRVRRIASQPPSGQWPVPSGLPPAAPMEVSAELLGQSDDDALGATQEAESVDVLVLRDLADQFGAVAAQAGYDVVDVVDSEHDAAYAQRVRRRVFRVGFNRQRPLDVRQCQPSAAVA